MKDIDGNFAANEGEYWEKLTEGDVYDLDLFTACAIGDYGFVENLLSFAKYRSEIINKKNEGGWTPLMYVSYLGDDKLLELLIREQADILAEEDKHGMTPLILASTSGNTSVVKRLVEKGADVNVVDKNGQTPLFYAARQGHLEVVKYLLKNKANVLISQNETGYTPFMEAAREGNEFVFNVFLEHGVDLSLACNSGLTARDLAYQSDCTVIVNMIDNHVMKRTLSSLRDEPELRGLDLGVDEIQQPQQKVHEWLNDRNHGVFGEAKAFGDVEHHSKLWSTKQSSPVSIDPHFTRNTSSDPFGKSLETLVDSDITPVGTPVDNILQQYTSGERRHQGRCHGDTLPSLENFLAELHLEKYQNMFEEECVDFRVLVSLTEEDFKDLGIKFGPRRKLKNAIDKWKQEARWSSEGKSSGQEVDNLRRQLAEVFGKLQRVTHNFVSEKEARSSIQAEQMEERAKRNHIYFIAEKIQRSCQELRYYSKSLRELVNTLGISASATRDVTGEELHSKLKTLHEQMASDVQNTEHVVDVILRRIRKMTSDDPAALSSDSDSPGSSCASISKSESSTGYSQ